MILTIVQYSEDFEGTKDAISNKENDEVYSEDEGFEDDVDDKKQISVRSESDGIIKQPSSSTTVTTINNEYDKKMAICDANSKPKGKAKSTLITINEEYDKKMRDAINLSKGLSVEGIVPKKQKIKKVLRTGSKEIGEEEDTDLSRLEVQKGQPNIIKRYPSKEEKKAPSPSKIKQNQEKIDIENEKKVDLLLQSHKLYKEKERTENVDDIQEQDTRNIRKKKKKKVLPQRSSSTGNTAELDPDPKIELDQIILMKKRERALLEAIEDLSAQLTGTFIYV